VRTGNFFFIVDDDPDDQELFIEALKGIDEFCEWESTFNGEEAIEKLKRMTRLPDFIFLDLNMPRMNGKQFLAYIKNSGRFQDIPVVIYSTSSDQKDMQETTDLGAVYFLQKPNRFDFLLRELEDIIKNNGNKKP
jgi:CheY-like chemotaxis protein